MANIKPLQAISVNGRYAGQLVFTRPQTASVAGNPASPETLPPLKTLLESGARQRPEIQEAQFNAYHDIRETLDSLLQKGKLLKEKDAGIYIYEFAYGLTLQTGVWALTDLKDYASGLIKVHELTFDDSVRRLKNYREHTGLEGSPVLLTYKPEAEINQIIKIVKTNQQPVVFGNGHGTHSIWKISDKTLIDNLIEAFGSIQQVYLADGHHRMESAAQLAAEQEAGGQSVFSHISSLYMASDELQIKAYHRMVVPTRRWDKYDLFGVLSKHYYMQDAWANRPVQPQEKHLLGMQHDGQWYHMAAKPHTYTGRSQAEALDASILQNEVFNPVFGISDPRNDEHLKYAGGEKAMEEINELYMQYPDAITFTLSPLSSEELMEISDAGEILPPKSTWFAPKVPYGLILFQHPIHVTHETC